MVLEYVFCHHSDIYSIASANHNQVNEKYGKSVNE